MLAPGKMTAPDDGGALEIKGTVSSLTVLRLRTTDVERIAAELAERVVPYPQIFAQAPVVVDASLVDGQPVPWEALGRAVRAARLVPVGAAHLGAGETERAAAAGFGLVQIGPRLRTAPPTAIDEEIIIDEEPPVMVLPMAPPAKDSLLVAQPVRGGQVVYARGADLVVRSQVNPGAQLIADGNINVWSRLRGRALAGAKGRRDARIFCLSLEAELLSVAGVYIMAEEIPEALRGRPAQVFLDGERVRIAAL